MKTRVAVVVDRHDDIATVRIIDELVDREQGILAVAVPPGHQLVDTIPAAILYALGKRPTRSHRFVEARYSWRLADIWLQAHDIVELIITHAQHLDEPGHERLLRLGEDRSVVLVYTGDRAAQVTPTTTLRRVTRRGRPASSPPQSEEQPWPESVPTSHPLRFRYDCACTLNHDDFDIVDQVLTNAFLAFERWLAMHPGATRSKIAEAASILTAGHLEAQRTTRRNAAHLALIAAGRALPGLERLAYKRRPITATEQEVAAVLDKTDPRPEQHRAIQIAAAVDADELALIGDDQVTARSLLGQEPPDPFKPYFRARAACGAKLTRIPAEQGRLRNVTDYAHAAYDDSPEELARLLSQLSKPGVSSIHPEDASDAAKHNIQDLAGADMLIWDGLRYKKSDIAAFSDYTRAQPPLELYQDDYGRWASRFGHYDKPEYVRWSRQS